ncbi:Nucleoside-diphosphate-sugar epimerase [Methylobacterium phyllostachyos]|uniref:Nucleoside-diphosphate-sugar epimerase n=1 Tax=Methylobacterium phyllostachyos TaxID=582672 RepID=A0A1H0L8M5_9HYPH|nr:SDR family oxidoreductase [Methylobacterium phyllostachyos]SDO64432.1 Nucleoside-diphosphate-sugar epimerase [Methylobacterium phyllostachyos]
MRIFLTGATGFIGTALIPELHAAGHRILGFTRSEAGAHTLTEAGVEPLRGDLTDLDRLRAGAAEADGVIHTAFDHDDFSNFIANCEKDQRAIAALGDALAGSDRPLLITSGTGIGCPAPGVPATEDVFNAEHPNPRIASELAGAALLEAGINVAVMRLPQVHDTVKQGLVTYLIDLARRTGISAYIGDGANRWAAGPVRDVARLYRLALEAGEPGVRYHAVAEEGVPARALAEVIGRGLKVPVVSLTPGEAAEHFGWLAAFAALDMPASSAWTRSRLGWEPTGRGLIADLERMDYARAI